MTKENKFEEILGNVSSIETTGFVDGPGIRVLVFLQGCPLRCLYCHNPENLSLKTQKTLMTSEEVVKKIKRYSSYFGKEGGVTFSGGEPLMQSKFLLQTLKLCKENDINTAIDTSGCAENFEEILDYVDTVILDIKAIDPDKYKKLTGQTMDRFNNFLKVCQKKKKHLWLRQVIVPGFNDTEEDILQLKKFISKIKNVKKVELLPYHDMAKDKYKKLGIKYRLEGTPAMDKAKCLKLQKLLLKKDKIK